MAVSSRGLNSALARKESDKVSGAFGPEARVVVAGTNRGGSREELRAAVREAAEAATDFSWLSRGDAVLIKPAHNSGQSYPATTSPVAIGTMVEMLLEKGAGRVIVADMAGIHLVRLRPHGLSGSTRRLMEASGASQAALAAGAELHFFEEAGWEAFYEDGLLKGHNWTAGVMMPSLLKAVQHIVLMPRCARHALAGNSLGMKAAVGYWRTDTRLEYHRDAATLQAKTAEGNTAETLRRKQRLVLTAADKVLATMGPDRGQILEPETGLIIASEPVVAHDMVSLAWLVEGRSRLHSRRVKSVMETSQFLPWIGNRVVVTMLRDLPTALRSETLTRDPMDSIWDDRMLNRAYELLGGVPRVLLRAANALVPQGLLGKLHGMVTAR